jgi:hypothetical protein
MGTRCAFPRIRGGWARQSLAVASSPQAKEDQQFIDAISDWDTA